MAAGAAAARKAAAVDAKAARGWPAPGTPGPARRAAPARGLDLAGHTDPGAAADCTAAVADTGTEVRAVRAGAAPAGPVACRATGSALARPGPGHRRETVPQRYRLGGLAADSSRPSPRRRRCFLPIPGRHGRLPQRTISANSTQSRDQAVSGRHPGRATLPEPERPAIAPQVVNLDFYGADATRGTAIIRQALRGTAADGITQESRSLLLTEPARTAGQARCPATGRSGQR